LDESHDLRGQRLGIVEHRQVAAGQRYTPCVRAVPPNFFGAPGWHDVVRVVVHRQNRLPTPSQGFAHICPKGRPRSTGQPTRGDTRPRLLLRNSQRVLRRPTDPDRQATRQSNNGD